MAENEPMLGNGAKTAPSGLERFAAAIPRDRPLPPVDQWHPPYCGDIDMRIARDGRWFYNGTPILRPALVKLFASILRKDPERFVLVTPVESVGIIVEDAPFIAIECSATGNGVDRVLKFRTNVDDWVVVDAAHPLRFEPAAADGLKPYVLVRGALWALATRQVALDLVGLGETEACDGIAMFGVRSGKTFFPMAAAQDSNGD